jgi:hypothetical protein
MRQLYSPNREISILQDSTQKYLDQLYAAYPIQEGVLITREAFTATEPKTIFHGLGRTPRGYIVVASSNYANFKDNLFTPNAPANDRTILLTSDATTTINLWVF